MSSESRAEDISQEAWEVHRAEITLLFPNHTYAEIRLLLSENRGFNASKSQFENQVQKQWKLKKYTKTHLKVKANTKLQARQGRPTEILIDNRQYTERQVKKAAAAEARQKRKAGQEVAGQSTQKQSSGKRPKRTATDTDGIAEEYQELCPSSPDNIIVRTPPALKASVASPSNNTNLVRVGPPQTPINRLNTELKDEFLHQAEMNATHVHDTPALHEEQPNILKPSDWANLHFESALGMEFMSKALNLTDTTLSELQSLVTKLTKEGSREHTKISTSPFQSTEPFHLIRSLIHLGSNDLVREEDMVKFLEWISKHQLFWIVGFLIDSHLPGAAPFCSQLFNRAVATGKTDIVNAMLDKGIDPNLKGNFTFRRGYGCSRRRASPLQAAIEYQDADMVRVLLTFGAKVENHALDIDVYGGYPAQTDLDIALERPETCPIIIKLLLSHGADVTVPMAQGKGYTTVLNRALQLHDGEIVKTILSAGARVNDYPNGLSVSALQTAAACCDSEIVRLIIEAGADVNIPIGSEYHAAKQVAKMTENHEFLMTPLQYAVKRNDIAVAKLLLAKGAFVDGFVLKKFFARCYNTVDLDDFEERESDSDLDTFHSYMESRFKRNQDDLLLLMQERWLYSPLQAAAANKNLAMVQLFLDHNCTINIMGGLGTALQVACMQQGNMKVVKLLIEKGADVNCPALVRNGRTALQAAILSGDLQVAEYLLEKNADVQTPASSDLSRTALQAATIKGYIQLVINMITRGANVNEATSMQGDTCLHLAARSGNMELVCLLLKHGAHVNKPVEAQAWHTSILIQAISSGKNEIVKKILANGAKASQEVDEKEGNGLISAAVRYCSSETVELLLREGASPNKVDGSGHTPLEYAVDYASLETIQLLLDFGADPNMKTSSRSSILTTAIIEEDEDLVSMLIAKGAKVTPPDDYLGRIPLAAAIRGQNFNILRMLLAANVNIHGRHGIEGLMEAIGADNMYIVQFLLCSGLTAKHMVVEGPSAQFPLTQAIRKNNKKLIDLLLDHDTDFYSKDSRALPEAVKDGDLQLIQRLLSLALDVNAQRAYDGALYNAVSIPRELAVIEALIAAGADVNALAGRQLCRTIFNAAIDSRSLAIVRLLLQKGAHVNPSSTGFDFDDTPLHCAVRTGNTDLVTLLLSHGANVNAWVAKYGRAFELAAEMGRSDFLQMMFQYHKDPANLDQRIQSAARVATRNGYPLVVKCLEGGQKNGRRANVD